MLFQSFWYNKQKMTNTKIVLFGGCTASTRRMPNEFHQTNNVNSHSCHAFASTHAGGACNARHNDVNSVDKSSVRYTNELVLFEWTTEKTIRSKASRAFGHNRPYFSRCVFFCAQSATEVTPYRSGLNRREDTTHNTAWHNGWVCCVLCWLCLILQAARMLCILNWLGWAGRLAGFKLKWDAVQTYEICIRHARTLCTRVKYTSVCVWHVTH